MVRSSGTNPEAWVEVPLSFRFLLFSIPLALCVNGSMVQHVTCTFLNSAVLFYVLGWHSVLHLRMECFSCRTSQSANCASLRVAPSPTNSNFQRKFPSLCVSCTLFFVRSAQCSHPSKFSYVCRHCQVCGANFSIFKDGSLS